METLSTSAADTQSSGLYRLESGSEQHVARRDADSPELQRDRDDEEACFVRSLN